MLLNSIAMLFQTYTTVDPKQMAFPDQLEDKMGDKLRELEDKPKNQTQHPKQGGHTKNPRHLAMKSVSSTQGKEITGVPLAEGMNTPEIHQDSGRNLQWNHEKGVEFKS